MVGVVLEAVGAVEEVVVVDDMVEAVVLEEVGAVELAVVDEVVEVEVVELVVWVVEVVAVDDVVAEEDVVEVEVVVVLVETGTVYWKVIVPLALLESTAVITYVPVSHAELPPTFVL
jgi:hypothetical protein